MTQPQDAQPPAPTTPRHDLKTLLIGLFVAAAGGGTYVGVDAAGYTPDAELLKALGIGGAILIVGYLHFVWLPLFRQKGTTVDGIDKKVDAANAKLDAVSSKLEQLIKSLTTTSIVAFVLCWSPGCGWLKSETKQTAGNVVDCGTAKARDAIGQFAPTLEQLVVNTIDSAGKADWNTIESATKGYVADVGGCVLQVVVTRLLDPVVSPDAPASSPLPVDKADLDNRWAALRATRYGGAMFKGAW